MTPRWVARASLGLALAALAVSAYLTIAHLTSPRVLACSSSGAIDCARVTTSAQSRWLGIPVAELGLAWSVGAVALCLPIAWASRSVWIRRARIVLVSVGMAFVLWLVYAELFEIRAICLWCTVMHLVVFGLFALVALAGVGERHEREVTSSP